MAELACAAGYSSRVDPALLTTLRQTPKVQLNAGPSIWIRGPFGIHNIFFLGGGMINLIFTGHF